MVDGFVAICNEIQKTMTDKPSSGAVVALPSIGDPAVLADILMYSGRDALSVMMTEDGDPNDYAKIVFGVASIFMGNTDSLELPAGWDPQKAGAALRPVLAEVLDEMPEEDRETFADDESLLALAVMTCFQEAASIAEAWAETNGVDDVETLLKGVLQDDLFAAHFRTWAEMILGIAPEDTLEEEAK